MDEPTDEESCMSQGMAQDEILALTKETLQLDQTP
jgi:predicted RNase H-like HicB family nuclease